MFQRVQARHDVIISGHQVRLPIGLADAQKAKKQLRFHEWKLKVGLFFDMNLRPFLTKFTRKTWALAVQKSHFFVQKR